MIEINRDLEGLIYLGFKYVLENNLEPIGLTNYLSQNFDKFSKDLYERILKDIEEYLNNKTNKNDVDFAWSNFKSMIEYKIN